MTSKHPNCPCRTTKYDYFRRRYRNGTLHLWRKCQECGKTGQNALQQQDYDPQWINTLQIMENGVMEQPEQPRAEPVRLTKPKNRVQSRADAIQEKLSRHIQNRSL